MFYNATAANPDVTNWDVSNVTNMQLMFMTPQTPHRCEQLERIQRHQYVIHVLDADGCPARFLKLGTICADRWHRMLSDIDVGTGSYSALLIQLAIHNNETNGTLDGGNATYTTDGAAARAVLEANGWTIT